MKPSEHIKQRIEEFVEKYQPYWNYDGIMQKEMLAIIDEAVREAILLTAKVMKEDEEEEFDGMGNRLDGTGP